MKYSVLLADNNRAKAYMQTLCEAGLPPAAAVVLGQPGGTRAGNHSQPETSNIIHSRDADAWFDAHESVLQTLEKHAIPHTRLDTPDINTEETVQAVRALPGSHCLYAGPGGLILGRELLGQGKIFLHAHPGRLPQYRGSTTFYYSLLAEARIHCSVIAMAPEIDAGPVLHEQSFSVTDPEIHIDSALDPLIRAATMRSFLAGDAPAETRGRTQEKDGTTLYIIHPVLKHAAILRTRAACEPGPTSRALAAMGGPREEHDG